LGEEHPDTVRTMSNVGVLYRNQGRYAEAESILSKTLEVRRRVLGEAHFDTLVSMHNLAAVYRDAEKYAQAEPLFTRPSNCAAACWERKTQTR
jgi:tetratricopeptide (TPR) repeat protein